MIYDLMPTWLRRWLQMDRALLPTNEWSWRHTCRFGRDPAKITRDEFRYRKRIGAVRY